MFADSNFNMEVSHSNVNISRVHRCNVWRYVGAYFHRIFCSHAPWHFGESSFEQRLYKLVTCTPSAGLEPQCHARVQPKLKEEGLGDGGWVKPTQEARICVYFLIN